MEISISVDDTSIRKKLAQMTSDLNDFHEPLNKAGDTLLKFFSIDVFESQGRALGESWRPLANATLRARARRSGYYSNTPIATDKILIWTGRMQKGFNKKVTADTLRIFNDIEWFQYHQERGGRTPQRRMLGITSEVIAKVVHEFSLFLEKTINK